MLALLEALLAATCLSLTPAQKSALLHYLTLLNQWNRVYNLTAVRQPEQMLSRHIMDSLSIAPFLEGDTFVDVGSGAGLPGIPLAIAQPERQFTLLDSAGKRTRFLTHVQRQLGLRNVSVLQDRVESVRVAKAFDGVVSRAFASLSTLLTRCHPLLAAGKFYAMKGKLSEKELAEIPPAFQIVQLIPLQVPGLLHEERHLVVIKSTATPPAGDQPPLCDQLQNQIDGE